MQLRSDFTLPGRSGANWESKISCSLVTVLRQVKERWLFHFFFAPQWLMFFVSDLKYFQKRIPSKVLFWSIESTWSTLSAVICQGWLGILLAKYCAGSKETSEEAAYTLDPWSTEKEGDSRMKFGSLDHLDCWFSSWLYQLHLFTWFLQKNVSPWETPHWFPVHVCCSCIDVQHVRPNSISRSVLEEKASNHAEFFTKASSRVRFRAKLRAQFADLKHAI